uniref:Ig-like domain-containing protein n=1 Tax=Amphimedon queenslandica TaxID=400682 RepID=A0A1X7SSM7_AMPQE
TYVTSIIIPVRLPFLIKSSLFIECIILLNTPVGPGIQPNVTWYYDMTDITHYSSLMRNNGTLFTSLLTIDSIQVSDAGVYHCSAGIDSNVTTNNISVCVTVNETLPLVTDLELSLVQNYSIDCITGPVPTGVSVSWLLTNGSIYSNNNTLMIPSILPSHNNTQYNCTIMIETNPSDCSTQSKVITLRVKATYIDSVFITPTSIVGFFINSTVVLTCTISLNTGIGPDTPFISHYWYQYSTDITNRSTPLLINGDSKNLVTTLNITSVQLSDAGVYQCRASIDGNDTVISNVSNLCIQVPVINISFDADLRLGDVREYDCILDTFITEVMTKIVSLNLSNTYQQLECHIATNTDINTTNTDINSIVNVSWYRDNGNENRLVSDSEGVSILPIVPVTDTSFISTLRFSPITSSAPVSTLGNYTCVAWIGEQSGRRETSINVQVTMKSKYYIINLFSFMSFACSQ